MLLGSIEHGEKVSLFGFVGVYHRGVEEGRGRHPKSDPSW